MSEEHKDGFGMTLADWRARALSAEDSLVKLEAWKTSREQSHEVGEVFDEYLTYCPDGRVLDQDGWEWKLIKNPAGETLGKGFTE